MLSNSGEHHFDFPLASPFFPTALFPTDHSYKLPEGWRDGVKFLRPRNSPQELASKDYEAIPTHRDCNQVNNCNCISISLNISPVLHVPLSCWPSVPIYYSFLGKPFGNPATAARSKEISRRQIITQLAPALRLKCRVSRFACGLPPKFGGLRFSGEVRKPRRLSDHPVVAPT